MIDNPNPCRISRQGMSVLLEEWLTPGKFISSWELDSDDMLVVHIDKLPNKGNSPDNEYEPFGDEWRKEMMKLTKSQLIDFIKRIRCR